MLLEKSENILELSVKQLVIQSRLPSSISLGQAMFVVLLVGNNCCLKGNNRPKSLPKSFPVNYSKKFL